LLNILPRIQFENMPKTSKAKKKVSKVKSKPVVKTKAKAAIKPKIVAKGPIKISVNIH